MVLQAHLTRRIAVALIAFGLSGCASVYVELDRMVGTNFPGPATIEGQTRSLASIYQSVGITLQVDEDNADIPRLNIREDPYDLYAHDFITDAELETILMTYRDSPVIHNSWQCEWPLFRLILCKQYNVYGLVVDLHANLKSGRFSNLYGIMYDTRARSYFVMFSPAVLPNGKRLDQDERGFLFVTAHELGHSLNLHHEEAICCFSIMHPLDPDIYDLLELEFSDCSREHLKTHSKQFVWPGLGLFDESLHGNHLQCANQ